MKLAWEIEAESEDGKRYWTWLEAESAENARLVFSDKYPSDTLVCVRPG